MLRVIYANFFGYLIHHNCIFISIIHGYNCIFFCIKHGYNCIFICIRHEYNCRARKSETDMFSSSVFLVKYKNCPKIDFSSNFRIFSMGLLIRRQVKYIKTFILKTSKQMKMNELPLYYGPEVWEIWNQTHLVVLNFCLERLHHVTFS